eukprot:TRINITY_DN12744_c0_g6_i1.p1 TRINITY_DN12744_c0_g6~~TRINITY_DN12744_c0_g6_i1.p1  ORF type:complete len:229 (+),score=51.76 TRINITY_DN12744_c0_g6_i1:48-689(+)
MCIRDRKYPVLKRLEASIQKNSEEDIAAKLLNNMGSYFHLATSAYAAICDKRFRDAGANVGAMVNEIFLLPGADNSMKEFVAGFAESIRESKDPAGLFGCAKENKALFDSLNNACDLIRGLIPENMLKGSKILLNATREFMRMLSPCMNGYSTFKRLNDKLRSATPEGMVRLMNRAVSTFFHLANDAVEAFAQKKHKKAGIAVGAIFKELFLH